LSGTPDLRQQPYGRRLFTRDVFGALIARGAKRPEVRQLVFSAQALVLDVADVEANLSPSGWIDVAGGKTAHLTGDAITFGDGELPAELMNGASAAFTITAIPVSLIDALPSARGHERGTKISFGSPFPRSRMQTT
jgi:hypothetical protein